jgi:hypothetical protein
MKTNSRSLHMYTSDAEVCGRTRNRAGTGKDATDARGLIRQVRGVTVCAPPTFSTARSYSACQDQSVQWERSAISRETAPAPLYVMQPEK